MVSYSIYQTLVDPVRIGSHQATDAPVTLMDLKSSLRLTLQDGGSSMT